MKLSNKARYAVRAMFDIAYHGRGEATQVKAIAERQAVPHRFLEQIFQDLKRAALVTSTAVHPPLSLPPHERITLKR
ncbi:MAG: Rrf2 family transcriptional regulator [Myxococcota bacterium]